jgi:hypothetical protein
MLCPKTLGLSLSRTPGIADHTNSTRDNELLPSFEGSRSSTKRHKTLTHDPLKKIQRKTLSNLQNKLKNENTKEALKDPRKLQC